MRAKRRCGMMAKRRRGMRAKRRRGMRAKRRCGMRAKRRHGMREEALDLGFELRPQAFLGDVSFVLLSASTLPKSVSVEEAQ